MPRALRSATIGTDEEPTVKRMDDDVVRTLKALRDEVDRLTARDAQRTSQIQLLAELQHTARMAADALEVVLVEVIAQAAVTQPNPGTWMRAVCDGIDLSATVLEGQAAAKELSAPATNEFRTVADRIRTKAPKRLAALRTKSQRS